MHGHLGLGQLTDVLAAGKQGYTGDAARCPHHSHAVRLHSGKLRQQQSDQVT